MRSRAERLDDGGVRARPLERVKGFGFAVQLEEYLT